MSLGIETRMGSALTAPQLTTREAGTGRSCAGYASVFYDPTNPTATQFELAPGIVERVLPRAFDVAIRDRHDAIGNFQHDDGRMLGRVSSGTMRLSVDRVGLRYVVDLPDTPTGNEVFTLLQRRDLSGSSFAFAVLDETWSLEGDTMVREIKSVQLYDCAVVARGAYSGATSGTGTTPPPVGRSEDDDGGHDRRARELQLKAKE